MAEPVPSPFGGDAKQAHGNKARKAVVTEEGYLRSNESQTLRTSTPVSLKDPLFLV